MTTETDGKADLSIRGRDGSCLSETRSLAVTSIHRCRIWHWVTVQKFYICWALAHSVQIYTPTFHSDDSTFITSGSGPACETVTEEVTLFVLAPYRTSDITGRRRALIWNIFKCEKTKTDRQTQRKKCYYCFKVASVQTGCIQWV